MKGDLSAGKQAACMGPRVNARIDMHTHARLVGASLGGGTALGCHGGPFGGRGGERAGLGAFGYAAPLNARRAPPLGRQ